MYVNAINSHLCKTKYCSFSDFTYRPLDLCGGQSLFAGLLYITTLVRQSQEPLLYVPTNVQPGLWKNPEKEWIKISNSITLQIQEEGKINYFHSNVDVTLNFKSSTVDGLNMVTKRKMQ